MSTSKNIAKISFNNFLWFQEAERKKREEEEAERKKREEEEAERLRKEEQV